MKALLVIASLAVGLALVSTAAARDGAQVVNASGCVSIPLATMCYDTRTVATLTTTASGIVAYAVNGVSSYSYDFPFAGCSYSRSQPVHLHWLEKNGDSTSSASG